MRHRRWLAVCGLASVLAMAAGRRQASGGEPPGEGATVKAVLNTQRGGPNRLDSSGWRPYEKGFQRAGSWFLCDNGGDQPQPRGLSQTVELNQTTPAPIVAAAWSKSERVTGAPDADYSLYLDIVFVDGTPLWGQSAPFAVGSHDWQRRQVVVVPDKPIARVHVHLLLRGHAGKVWFRDPELRVVQTPAGAGLFDGVPVNRVGASREGFQLRDVAAGSDFVRIERSSLGIELQVETTRPTLNTDGGNSGDASATLFDVTVRDTTGRDRAITLLYAVPVTATELRWLHDPRQTKRVEPGREYLNGSRFRVGANGRLSRYPFAAVADAREGIGLGIDVARPAFYRVAYNASARELYLAFDLGLAPEKPTAHLRFCRFTFDAEYGFRAALARYYQIFPEAFRCRTPEQGLWMPFASISKVKGWQDFGFKFKEGNNETEWDDQQGITTFRYTEPMTWWMRMPEEMPRTLEAALREAKRLADAGNQRAQSLLNSGFHNESGQFAARLLDTPWCNGAVWSMNAMPGLPDDPTEFKLKWNDGIRDKLYGRTRVGDLDGEYVDSSEGYVTDELDFCRTHFAAASTPLCFAPDTHRVALFRGLIAFEYVRALAEDVHGTGKLMMANSTPSRLCWLAPLLDVMGTETDWHRAGQWRPMSDAEMLYRRALCKGKPFCFLMNTRFEEFSSARVEKYMKRTLAYGMFPGFFSHNASQGHYFTRPELYDRDRPLFKKYVPLCKRVAEAGWEPITHARSDDERVYVERFGQQYLTVFNDSAERRTVTISLDESRTVSARDLVSERSVSWREGKASLALDGQDVALLEIGN